jgi:uncharacterized protein YjbJ (UPF0337 family)
MDGEEMTMAKNWDEIASRWTRFSRDVKKKWGGLTDDEVMQVNGRRDILAGKIQEKYGIAVEEADKQIDAWASKLKG